MKAIRIHKAKQKPALFLPAVIFRKVLQLVMFKKKGKNL